VAEAGAAAADARADALAPAASTAAAVPPGRAPLPPGEVDFSRRQLVMVFTCAKCETRGSRAFSREAYETGVVIVECPSCDSRHLVADHLGWFGEKGTVEDFAAARGGGVLRRVAGGGVELTLADVVGPSAAAAAAAAAAPGGGEAEAAAPR
jgi:hypothetical protein